MKNTSISLENYFGRFVSNQVSAGRYKNVSEVIRAGLRLLEDEKNGFELTEIKNDFWAKKFDMYNMEFKN